jgi:hypothetical protein
MVKNASFSCALLLLVASGCARATPDSLEKYVVEKVVLPNRIIEADGTFTVQEKPREHAYLLVAHRGGNQRSIAEGDHMLLTFPENDVIPIDPSTVNRSTYIPFEKRVLDGSIRAVGNVRIELEDRPGNQYNYRFSPRWTCVLGRVDDDDKDSGWKCEEGRRGFYELYAWARDARDRK